MAVTVNELQIEIGASSQRAVEQIAKVTAALGKLQNKLNTNFKNPLADFVNKANTSKFDESINETAKALKQLQSATNGGSKSFERVATGLKAVSEATEGFAGRSDDMQRFSEFLNATANAKALPKALPERISAVATAASEITPETISNLQGFTNALQGLSGVDLGGVASAIKAAKKTAQETADSSPVQLSVALNASAIESSVDSVGGLRTALMLLQSPLIKVRSLWSKLANGERLNKPKDDVKKLGDEAKRTTSKLGTIVSAMKRIAFYRAIRAVIKGISDAFREGTNNLYQYSLALNSLDSARAANTLDSFATSALYVKNTLASAVMPAITALEPYVLKLADAFVYAANAVNQFLSAIFGSSGTWTKAVRYATSYGNALDSAAGSAAELKRQVFGFDELNIFNDTSSRGGGVKELEDYSKMFEEIPIDSNIRIFSEKIKEAVNKLKDTLRLDDLKTSLKLTIKEVLPGFSSAVTPESIAEKIIAGLGALIGGVAGFAFGGVPGAIKGSIIGASLGIMFDSMVFDHDGTISSVEVAGMLRGVLYGITGAAIGWQIGGLKGALIGASIGVSLAAIVSWLNISEKNGYKINPIDMVVSSVAAIIALGKMGAFTVTTASELGFGSWAALGFLAAVGIKFSIQGMETVPGMTENQKFIQGLVTALGVIGAGVIGFAFGGPAGAVIGISVAAGLTFLLNQIDWNTEAISKRELDYGLNNIVDNASAKLYAETGSVKPKIRTTGGHATEFASGGFPDEGSLFFAGEAGPELVGTVNGRTGVVNREQLTAGFEDIMDNTNSVILQAALNIVETIRAKNTTPVVKIGDKDVANAAERGNRLMGASLVR